jgi:hypothetical protein
MQASRTPALIAVPITALAVLYAVVSALTGWEPALGWLLQAVIHVGELLVVVALLRSGGPGRIGLYAAALGQAILAVAEVIWPHWPGVGDTMFTVGPLLTGVGLTVAGIAALRGREGAGRRLLPLATGIWVFIALIPSMIATGGPPSPVALAVIAVWDALWTFTALAVLRTAASTPSAAEVGAGAPAAGV